MRARTIAGWLAVLALIELSARALVYALAPTPAPHLSGQLGGPRFALVTLIALGLACVLAAAIVALASMGARERWRLAPDRYHQPPPRLPAGRVLRRAGGLWIGGMLLFAAVESWIHLRAGMGFHGLGCLLGPVHRNAIPVIGALSLIAAAAISGAAHLLRWMRRALGRVYGVRTLAREVGTGIPPVPRSLPRSAGLPAAARPRAPPLLAV
jgi:hypothetical protein